MDLKTKPNVTTSTERVTDVQGRKDEWRLELELEVGLKILMMFL